MLLCSGLATVVVAQDTTKVSSVDPDLLALQTAKIPKEYTIRSIRVTGVTSLDTAIVLSISGLQVGDKVMMPGSDVFAKAINNLWRQRFFSNVEIYITAVKDDFIDLELNVYRSARSWEISTFTASRNQRRKNSPRRPSW
jgi:outer membrane protein insertion porin family